MIFLIRLVVLDGFLSNIYFVKFIVYDIVYFNIQVIVIVIINVNRNFNLFIFNFSIYRVILFENYVFGSVVVDVNVIDVDFVCIFFFCKRFRFDIFSILYNVLISMDYCYFLGVFDFGNFIILGCFGLFYCW